MTHSLNPGRRNLNTFACGSWWLAAIGRVLLILAAVSLLTMPLTQRMWTWDRFLHGGRDFESSMLVILTTLCLAVLLLQVCKRHVDSLFAAWRLFAFPADDDGILSGIPLPGASFVLHTEQAASSTIPVYSLPLQI